ncbi:MAG: hypothetical protein JWN34_1235 [Bryobacterales bacterium]|nr:hypothetical protein [Bryobacterales bacterium]
MCSALLLNWVRTAGRYARHVDDLLMTLETGERDEFTRLRRDSILAWSAAKQARITYLQHKSLHAPNSTPA